MNDAVPLGEFRFVSKCESLIEELHNIQFIIIYMAEKNGYYATFFSTPKASLICENVQ